VILTELAIKWKSSVFLLMILIIIFGVLAYIGLPKESNPDIPIPYVIISTAYEGVAPSDIESLIALPIERKLKGLDGVKQVSSYCSEGISNIIIEFMSGQDLTDALQRVKDKVSSAKADLPRDLRSDPMVFDLNISDFPVMELSIAGDIPEAVMKKIADEMKDRIEGLKGVQEAVISGARTRIILIEFDYERLQAYKLNILEIASALQQENVNIPGGSMDIGRGKYLLRIPGEFNDPSLIDNIVITTRNGLPIYLKDVAAIKDSFEDRDSYARLNSINTVSIAVKKRIGENELLLAAGVKEIVKAANEILPSSVRVSIIFDNSEIIEDMVHELENHLASGLFLVVLVLFFFLGKINSFFTALAIPFSMLISFIVFQYMGITLNMVVLFSLIMALGMLVDDAIVIVENIYRHMQEGMDRAGAAKAAVKEVGRPVIASTVTKICAFLPLLFWPGIVGKFMSYIPLTMIVTLVASLFVALVFNPVICSTFMRVKDTSLTEEGEIELGRGLQTYKRLINFALDHRAMIIISVTLFMFLPVFLFGVFGKGVEFFPDMDPQRAMIRITEAQGTNAYMTLQDTLKVEEKIKEGKNIDKILTLVGGDGVANASNTGGTLTHIGLITVVFTTFTDRIESSSVTLNRIRERVGSLAGTEIAVEKEAMGPPVGDPVSIQISGPDVDTLGEIASGVKERIRNIPGIVDLKDDFIKSKPEIRVNVDREKAALLGLSTYTISNAVKGAISGMKVGVYREGDDEYDIIVRLPEDKRKTVDDIKNLQIPARTGEYVPLSSVADVDLSAGFGRIARIDFKRVVNVTANADGRSGMEVANDVKKELSAYKLPDDYKIKFTGEDEEQQEASAFLARAFMIALFLILMVLMIEFNSISHTFIILGTVLLSIGGVFWGLLITRTAFGVIMSGMGVISLAGVIVNNGIIMIDYTNKLRERGYSMREAVAHAGAVRFRPVMLTAVTAILGLLPMAIGYGINFSRFRIEKGAEMSQFWIGMANSVIFGLAIGTLLTLVVVPVLYSFTGGGLKEDDRRIKQRILDILQRRFR
jgi:CzcA family heavy metal efflux pump